jgi:hypothetical protein
MADGLSSVPRAAARTKSPNPLALFQRQVIVGVGVHVRLEVADGRAAALVRWIQAHCADRAMRQRGGVNKAQKVQCGAVSVDEERADVNCIVGRGVYWRILRKHWLPSSESR